MALRWRDLLPNRLAADMGRSLEAHAALRAQHAHLRAGGGPAVFTGGGEEEITARSSPRTLTQGAAGGTYGFLNLNSPQQDDGLSPSSKRSFADVNEWMQAAINYIAGRISSAEWDFVPATRGVPHDEGVRQMLVSLLKTPNPASNNFRLFIEPVIYDIMVLGKGGWEYVPNFRGRPLSLYPFDAAFMSVDPTWDGSAPKKPRYAFKPPRQFKTVQLRNDDITLALLHPTTHRPEGWSYVDALRYTIEGDIAGNSYVRSLMRKYPPPGWLHLGDRATQKQVDTINEQLRANVLGRGGMVVTGMGGSGQKYEALTSGTGRDNELMAWSRWFAHKVAVVCGLSPQDLGITEDVNKGTGSIQADISTEGGVKGMMYLLECYINADLVPRYGDPRKTNVALDFKELTMRDRARMAEIAARVNGGTPVVMMNEARALLQYEPVDLGEAIYAPTPTGPVALIGPDAMRYRQQMADFAAANPPPPTGGEAAGGAGNKKAQSDLQKVAEAPLLVPRRRARTEEETAAHDAMAQVCARVLLDATGRGLESAYADLAAYERVRRAVVGLDWDEGAAAVFACERASLYLYEATAGLITAGVRHAYHSAGAPLGEHVAAAWGREGRRQLDALGAACAAGAEPLATLEAALSPACTELARDIARDLAVRFLRRGYTRTTGAAGATKEDATW